MNDLTLLTFYVNVSTTGVGLYIKIASVTILF